MSKPNFLDLAHFLKEKLSHVDLRIRRCKLSDLYGCCNKFDDYYQVSINSELCETAQILILIHEVAHALSYDKDPHPSDHGPIFGMAYARVWRLYLEWVNE